MYTVYNILLYITTDALTCSWSRLVLTPLNTCGQFYVYLCIIFYKLIIGCVCKILICESISVTE